MNTRAIAILLLVLVLGFIATMASVQYFIRDPLPMIGNNQMLHLRTRVHEPPLAVQIAIDGSYRVNVQLRHPGHEVLPEMVLRPTDAAPITLDFQQRDATLLAADGQLTRPGRWELDLAAQGRTETLRFIVRE